MTALRVSSWLRSSLGKIPLLRRSLLLELADDLDSFGEAFGYGCVTGSFHGGVP